MPAQAEAIAWVASLEEVRQQAVQDGKAILLDFTAAPDCSGCVAMDTVTYPDPRVAHFIGQHCHPIKVRVQEGRTLVDDYLVSWTPNVVLTDDQGRVHHRVEGFLPPEDFVAQLSLGFGKYQLNRGEFAQATERFAGIVQRHEGTDAAACALYWLGVARYKETHDPAQLHSAGWQQLVQEYPDSEWARRCHIPIQD